MIKTLKTLLVAGSLLGACAASATVLTATSSVDNGYQIFVSTSDSAQGVQFGAANDWYHAYTDTTTLAAGVDYFLHVYAYDQGGIAGFLGNFSLSGTDHTFSNGSTALSTDTTHWSANNTGWGHAYTGVTNLGAEGVYPWGNIGGISNADWIWSGDAWNNNQVWFSTKISAVKSSVAEPSAILLMCLGLLGLVGVRRKA